MATPKQTPQGAGRKPLRAVSAPGSASERPLRHYQGYGLRLESSVDLPWPAAAPGSGGEADLSIRGGAVPGALASPADECGFWQTAPGALLLNAPGIARCMVCESGRLIRFDPAEDGGGAVAAALESALAACLQMRGVLTLRASAVATAQGAAVLAGRAATGKSTLAAALVDLGYPLLADGIVAVAVAVAGSGSGGEAPRALAGFPSMRLQNRAMKILHPSWQSAAAPLRSGTKSRMVPARRFHGEAMPVRAVYLLNRKADAEIACKRLSQTQAFAALTAATCRLRFLRGLGAERDHFRSVASVAKRAPVERLTWPAAACAPPAAADWMAQRLPPPCP